MCVQLVILSGTKNPVVSLTHYDRIGAVHK